MTILDTSRFIEQKLGITFTGSEFNYGRGIGRADNFFELNQNSLCILEVESNQRHPEMNVLKIWPWLEANQDKKIILIQFILKTASVSPNRIQLCQWIGKKMERNLEDRFRYFLIIEILEDSQKDEIIKQIEIKKHER